MALIPCHECGAQISNDAKNCPKCGAANKRLKTMQTIGFGALVLAILVYLLESVLSS
jgi:ribosomal protein L40E